MSCGSSHFVFAQISCHIEHCHERLEVLLFVRGSCLQRWLGDISEHTIKGMIVPSRLAAAAHR